MSRSHDELVEWVAQRSLHGGADEIPLPGAPGRLWLAGKHLVGPDPEAALAALDADRIVCLCELSELEDRYPAYAAWLRAGPVLHRPIADLHAPDRASAEALVAELGALLDDGEVLVLHCGAGIGRAGTVAVALLLSRGAALEDALATVRTARPMAGPERGVQLELLEALAAASAHSA